MIQSIIILWFYKNTTMLRHNNIFMYVNVRKYYYLLMYYAKCNNTDNEILFRYSRIGTLLNMSVETW